MGGRSGEARAGGAEDVVRDIVGGGGGDATSVWGIVEATGGGHGATGGQRPSVWAMCGGGGVNKREWVVQGVVWEVDRGEGDCASNC